MSQLSHLLSGQVSIFSQNFPVYCARCRYEDHVNNSAYTNSVAKLALQGAVDCDKTLGYPPASYSKWQQAEAAIPIPFNASNGVHPEYDGYNGNVLPPQPLRRVIVSRDVLPCVQALKSSRRM